MVVASIQFFQGINEHVIPEIRLTKSIDGSKGRAFFRFENPNALSSVKLNQIQAMYLTDEEGQIIIREINIAVSKKDGKYTAIEAVYYWKKEDDFERFIRFANRYAKKYGLGYEGKQALTD